MNRLFHLKIGLSVLLLASQTRADDPAPEETPKASRLTLITAGSDLNEVFAQIEKQTGNKLVDETESSAEEPLPAWNFSLSDREFWPLVDKFLDAAELGPLNTPSENGLPIGRRPPGVVPRFGAAVYAGPFRLEVTQITSRLDRRVFGDHEANIEIQVEWEPRLRPLLFSLPLKDLDLSAAEEIKVQGGSGVLAVEASRDGHVAELHLPLQLPEKKLELIGSLKGRLKALVSTRSAEFKFSDLEKAKGTEQNDGGMKVTLTDVRQNQGLTELHMRLEFDKDLPEEVSQGSWNFQNVTYLKNSAGEKLEHAGFETTEQSERVLGMAYYFDVPEGKLADYTWVYECPAAIVEVPIEFEMKDIPLP